jgi:subfamily B ATP-binding cassette protein MsbA
LFSKGLLREPFFVGGIGLSSSKGIYFRMLEFARPYYGHLALAVLCMAGAAGLETLSMYLIKTVMDKGFLNPDKVQAYRMLVMLSAGIVVTMLAKGLFGYIGDILNNGVSNSLTVDVRQKLFDKLAALPLGFHSHQRLGELVSRLTNDATYMQSGISDVIGRVIGSGLRIVFLSGLIFYLNWRLSLQTAVIFPVAMLPLYQFGRHIRRYSSQDQERMADLSSLLHEVLGGIRVVKAFATEEREGGRFAAAAKAHYAAMMKKLRMAALSSPVMELIGGIGVALMIYLAGRHVIDGLMTIGDFLALIGAVASLYPHFKSLNGVNVSINNAIAAGERVFFVLDAAVEVADLAEPKAVSALKDKISFENVSFAYGEREVLSDLNFEVKAGQRVALVGPSGAGKTTLVDLVPRFHDVKAGRILWDGTDLRQASQKSLRAQIGVVTQETFLFNDTIARNIAYARPEASRAEIEAAARAANAHGFIMEQPMGYETMIGERGVRLSGGQRQRLAIARAILKNPPVLILDEATSALDTESERAVQEALDHLMEHRTTLVIAHRLSTVQHADEILVLDKGRIAERGRHVDLLAKAGLYARLYQMQFQDSATKADARV